MKYQSYWHDTAPVFSNPQRGPVAGSFDVVRVRAKRVNFYRGWYNIIVI